MKSQEEQWLLKEKYQGEKSAAFFADCKALALGEPLGYLIGHVPFLGCTIHLDNQPLIPRVETEFWVEQAIAAIKESQSLQSPLALSESEQSDLAQTRLSPGGFGWGGEGVSESGLTVRTTPTMLDLCAGSGCIGVAVAKHVPESVVDFGELSKQLVPTIKKNCVENGVQTDRYTIYHSNLFQNIPADATYDFILSNPPYIDPAVDRAEESVKTHEPHLALYGGVAGIEIIEQLIKAAPSHLTTGGQLWIEHEPEQSVAIQAIAREHNFAATNHPDQYGVIRYSILVLN
jgi:methylase of polypeptide subunit release factors